MSTSTTSNRSSQVKGSEDTFSWRRSRELMLSVSEEEKSPLISSTSTSWCDQHASDLPRADRSINASNSWILSTSVDYSYTHQHKQPPCEYKNQPTSIREFVCLGIFIFVAVFLFSVPIILRYVPIQIPLSITNDSAANSSNCSSRDDWVVSRSMSGCDAAVYTNNGVCYHQLSNWQQCALGETTTTMSVDINGTSVSLREKRVSMFISMIQAKASTECKRAAIPFVCQLIFPLCDNSTGTLVRPSKQACQHLKNGVCSTEMKQMPLPITPDCNKLPENNNTAPSAPVNCSDNFYPANDSNCQPSCTQFQQFSNVYIVLNKIVIIMFGAVGLLASIIVILAFVMRCKSGPLFPSLYYVYCSIGHTVISVIFILSAIEKGNFYCSSKSLFDSLDNPSPFCLISGAAVHYFLVNMMFWLVCYSLSIMFKVVFPIYSKRMEKQLGVVHIGVSILGWLVPLPAVVLALTNKDDGYIISFFPPLFCITRNMDVWFYSTMLVIDVLGMAHMSILVIIFCVVHKYQGILSRPLSKRQIRISPVEKKLLLIFIYYILAGTVALICFGLHTNQDIVNQYKQSLSGYFNCEASGLHPRDINRCEKSFADIQKHSFPLLFTIMILFVSLAPVVYLTFLFNWNLFKSKMQALFVTASSGHSTTQPKDSGVPVL